MICLRWICCGLLSLMWAMTGHAMTWLDAWETRDHQAETLWKAGEFSKAAKLFQRPDWRATSAYRAGDYQGAAQNYLGLQTTDGYYNAGNALAHAGQYQPAIAAYTQALQRDPQHTDALFNRQIVQKLLDMQKQSQSDKQQQQQQQQPSPSSQNAADSKSQEQEGQQSPKEPKKESPPTPTKPAEPKKEGSAAKQPPASRSEREQNQAKEQWLRLIPDDPAYLLREKFLRDHLQRQNGRSPR